MYWIVAATGGLETPSFRMFTNMVSALDLFAKWEGDLIHRAGDRVDLLQISEDETLTIIKSVEYNEEY